LIEPCKDVCLLGKDAYLFFQRHPGDVTKVDREISIPLKLTSCIWTSWVKNSEQDKPALLDIE
jgi:adenylate cyclase